MQWHCLTEHLTDGGNWRDAPAGHPSPNDRGMAYGDGFFTTIGVFAGSLLWKDYHQHRLVQHAHALHLTLTDEQITVIWQHAHSIAKQIEHGIIKLVVTRPVQAVRGYGFSPNPPDNVPQIWLGQTATDPLLDASEQAFNRFKLANYLGMQTTVTPSPFIQPAITAVCLDARLSSHAPPLAGLKTLNRLDNVMASGELTAYRDAHSSQYAKQHIVEGLVQDMAGNWVEGTMSNVFYRLFDGSDGWHTPPIASAGVAGVMRSVLMDKLADAGVPCTERPLTDADLPNLQAMFFCNAVRGVMPVERLAWGSDTIELQNT